MTKRFYKTIRFSLLLVLILISSIVFSQEKKIQFGVSFNAQLTHQITIETHFENSEDDFSYSIAGNVYYAIGSKFQLLSGLSLSHYKMNKIYRFNSTCGFTDNGELLESYYRHDYPIYYLGIPLEVRWNILGETDHLFLQFGLEGLLKLSSDASDITVFCGQEMNHLPQDPFFRTINNFLLLSKIGLGFDFRIFKKVNLFFEPNIQYSLTDLFKYDLYKSRFVNIGINTGIKF